MAIGRRLLRLALLLFVAGLGTAVLLGLRERAVPASGIVVERTDPHAVIQTRGSRIVQADALGDNFNLVAGRQLTYPGGGVRMLGGVEMEVGARDDREGFVLRGAEAEIDGGRTEVLLSGDVQFTAGSGLEARSEQASYARADGVVRMPGAASFARDGMRASGRQAVYERAGDLLRLWGDAMVELAAGEPSMNISAASALIAQTDGYMTFDGGVAIDADRLQMAASRARADVAGEISSLESLRLRNGARIVGGDRHPGRLRAMTASDIRLGYGGAGRGVEQAALTGDAGLALFGTGDRGTEIAAGSMDVGFAADGGGVSSLAAREGVVLDVAGGGSGPAQRISADALHGTSGPGGTLEQVRFDGAVEYREGGPTASGARIGRADHLETALTAGLSALAGATFRGRVAFEDGEVRAFGDEARYRVGKNTIDLTGIDASGQVPRVIDRRGSVQAGTIRLVFDGPRIAASESVESVLRPAADLAAGDVRQPGLLDSGQPVLVVADELAYDGRARIGTYAGGARLWQGETQFQGDTIVLDEAVGDLRIEGAARTRLALARMGDAGGPPQKSLSTGRGAAMRYDNAARRVIYTTDAGLQLPRGELTADEIQVHLRADDNALDRVTAAGNVTFASPGRRVAGDTLVYHDADGRYEMAGRPVRMVEQVDAACRETTGRTLTFFRTTDDVSVDGQAGVRTATASGECPESMSR